MTDHDPLCPDVDPRHFTTYDFYGNSMSCNCALLRKARLDERDRVAKDVATSFRDDRYRSGSVEGIAYARGWLSAYRVVSPRGGQ
jgi:hypothetical protein